MDPKTDGRGGTGGSSSLKTQLPKNEVKWHYDPKDHLQGERSGKEKKKNRRRSSSLGTLEG